MGALLINDGKKNTKKYNLLRLECYILVRNKQYCFRLADIY